MTDKRAFVHTVFLFLLPVLVAWFGWSVLTAVGVVLLMLVWRWMISLSTFVAPEKVPELVLETISVSHFVEKVRWNLDATDLDYVERTAGGTLGAFFLGRTVPRLKVRTGAVRSEIGNSAEILRYLWGAYAATQGEKIKHLEPTAERLEFEQRLDRYGVSLQIWIYHHILEDRELALHAWGVNNPAVPIWQRWLLRLLFPLLAFLIRRSFRITAANYEKACHRIEELLADIDTRLADGRVSILGDKALNYTDYSFAAFTGAWLQPVGYGGGKADSVRIERSRAPNPMRADIERWVEDYPRAVTWVQRLYAEAR
ncbi:MAG: hypothetical protein OER97_01880 [Gammaproteobacteria bacterium]|nr:hypothetical protein [Gammaproteobacteria bacterium]